MAETIRHNIRVLERARKDYISISAESIMSQLSPCVRDLPVDRTYIPDLDELRKWAAEQYEKNPREFPTQVILAKDGTRVRSRAECIIYNALLNAGIPFRYDPVLRFRRKNEYGEVEIVYESPDFQIKCQDGSFILLEHAGILTYTQYAESLAKKLQLYQLNGYTLGLDLFVTSDDIDGGINSCRIEVLIDLIRSRFSCL